MRDRAPFREDDLAEFDERMLSRATAVIAMQEVYAGNRLSHTIGMRHDLDAGHSLETAVKIAKWEADRGYRATFYLLHTSPYWGAPGWVQQVDRIACLGHEIGIHADALALALTTGQDPDVILDVALTELRDHGFTVRGVAGHGNPICNRDRAEGEITFANDEQFLECRRPQEGEADRTITRGNISLKLRPRPLADFGLDYEALFLGLPYPFRVSDSGGKWLNPGFEETADQFVANMNPGNWHQAKQLHVLWHPDWWAQAFTREAVVA